MLLKVKTFETYLWRQFANLPICQYNIWSCHSIEFPGFLHFSRALIHWLFLQRWVRYFPDKTKHWQRHNEPRLFSYFIYYKLPTYLPTCLPTYLPPDIPTYLPIYLPLRLVTFQTLPAYIPNCKCIFPKCSFAKCTWLSGFLASSELCKFISNLFHSIWLWHVPWMNCRVGTICCKTFLQLSPLSLCLVTQRT